MRKNYRRVALSLAVIAIAYAGATNVHRLMRSYEGYCETTGVRLTTAERLDIAVNHYVRQQTLTDLLEIRQAEGRSGAIEDMGRFYKLIPYQSSAEFRRENPDCCSRTWGNVEGDQFGFWERSEGAGDGMFEFYHRIRYVGEDGVEKVVVSRKTYYTVNNCGHARPRAFF